MVASSLSVAYPLASSLPGSLVIWLLAFRALSPQVRLAWLASLPLRSNPFCPWLPNLCGYLPCLFGQTGMLALGNWAMHVVERSRLYESS